jgi:nitrate/nitrite transport system substrate-binding protein
MPGSQELHRCMVRGGKMTQSKKKIMSRRQFIKKTATAAAAGVVLGNAPAFSSFVYGSTRIRIGVIAPSHCALPMVHAALSNTFKKNGVDAEIVYLPDMPDIAKGLLTNDLQAGQLISPVFFAMNAGIGPFRDKATPLVCAQTAGTNGGVLVRAKGSRISMPADLKGKNIGVHSPLMVHSLLFNTLLVRYNINPNEDLRIKIINMNQLIPALKNGEIDAFINPEPLATVSVLKGAGEEMMLSKDLWPNHPCCLIAMKENFFQQEKETAKAIYSSTMESGLLLDNAATRSAALEKIHADSPVYGKVPLPGLKKAFTPGRTDFQPFIYESSGRAVLGMMRDFRMLPDSTDINGLVARTCMSDLSGEILASVGGMQPAENSRQEKIVGKIVVSQL